MYKLEPISYCNSNFSFSFAFCCVDPAYKNADINMLYLIEFVNSIMDNLDTVHKD